MKKNTQEVVSSAKPWYRSKTIVFFSLVMTTGGVEVLEAYLQSSMTEQDFSLLVVGFLGIALRLVTKEPIL